MENPSGSTALLPWHVHKDLNATGTDHMLSGFLASVWL